MPFRGGPPPTEMPPSLLQMAQGNAPAMGGGGGVYLGMLGQFGRGGGPQGEGEAPNAGPSPAYVPGTSQGGYPAIFDARAPTNGGWFTMADYSKQSPTGNPPGMPGTYGPPSNYNALSTNNWRLLPPEFRYPN